MARYKRIVAEIEAILYTGENFDQVFKWAYEILGEEQQPAIYKSQTSDNVGVGTRTGMATCVPGSWLIYRNNEFYPCPADVFELNYEKV